MPRVSRPLKRLARETSFTVGPDKIPVTLRIPQTIQAAEVSVGEEGEDLVIALSTPAVDIHLLFQQDAVLDLVLRVVGRVIRRRRVELNRTT